MARLTLPMFTPLSEVVLAPLFRVLQNHGSLNRSFCEVTKGIDDSLTSSPCHLTLFPSTCGRFNKINSVFAGCFV